MVRILNVKKNFEEIKIEIDLEIKSNEIFGIIGESGSGKTTLLRMLQGIEKYDSGKIEIDENTATIFQDFNLLNNLNIFKNVEMPLKIFGKKDDEKVLSALKFVSLLDKKDNYPSSLSGGEKQRVSIARAIVQNPKVLLCDEPTASLDKKNVKEICELFKRINKEYGTCIILVTHELEVAKYICDRVAIIQKGKIQEIMEVKKSNIDIDTYTEYAKEYLKC